MTFRLAVVVAGTLTLDLAAGAGNAATSAAAPPAAAPATPPPLQTPPGRKPRVVITTDPELDDSNSLVRYLLYSADFQTEGLIYASSQFHWKGDGKGTKGFVAGREYDRFGLHLCPCTSWRWDPHERFIDDAVALYAQAWPNLHIHNPEYPPPESLRAKIRWGNIDFDGEMSHDTPGSDLIKSLLLDNDDSPVYLHAWGGQSTIARALKSIEEQYKGSAQWPAIYAKVSRKAVIHPSGDQDDTYAMYIQPNWPQIRYRRQAGGVNLSYNAQSRVSEQDAAYFTAEWTRTNISERGPLGAHYRVWGDGKQMVRGDIFDYFGISGKSAEELKKEGYIVWTPVHEKGSFLAEGDTATFLNLIDNGLRGYLDDSFGGWGGYQLPASASAGLASAGSVPRGSVSAGPHRSGSDVPGPGPAASIPRDSVPASTVFAGSGAAGPGPAGSDAAATFQMFERAVRNPGALPQLPRAATNPFLAAAQRDFAARFMWATTPTYAGANHPPQISARGPRLVSAKPGEAVKLSVTTTDPDGNAVTVRWWRWIEVGSYAGPGALELAPATGPVTSVPIPMDMRPGQTLHVIAEATDNGVPALTRYERFIVTAY